MWSFAPLSGEGAKKHGGRFNRPNKPALYTSLDPTTAWMEAQQGFPFKSQPMTLIAYEVDCEHILDLNDVQTLKSLAFSAMELACAWEYLVAQKITPPTWELADKLCSQDIAGILCRSFSPGCTEQNNNLILWDWSDSKPHAIRVIDDFQRLPVSKASWPDL